MAERPEIGDVAPGFALPGAEGTFRLSDHRGERVVLLFHPGDNTLVCTRQFRSCRDNPEAFGNLGPAVVGISSQSVQSHTAFRDKHGLTVPLLADEAGIVAKAHGAQRPLVGTSRAVVIVDQQGVARHRHDSRLGLTHQTADDLRAALDSPPAQATRE